jgi:hypothetical protein
MLKLLDNYQVQFKIGDQTDFINEGELIDFTYIAEAGNVLPHFDLEFLTRDYNILKYLHEGNLLSVSFGRNDSEILTVNLRIQGQPDVQRAGAKKYHVSCNGVYDALDFLKPRYNILPNTAKSVIQESVRTYFDTFDSNFPNSVDDMVWIQPSISTRRFTFETWMHMNLPGSFPVVAITSKGQYRLYDFRKLVSQKNHKWEFIPGNSNDDNLIGYNEDWCTVSNNTNLINLFAGYDREKVVYDLRTGEDVSVEETIESLIALKTNLTRRAETERRFSEIGVINDNVHPNYWQAAERNLQGLSVYSFLRIALNYSTLYFDTEPLDLVMFREPDPFNSQQASEYLSGRYVITKVVRQIQQRQLSTQLEMCRESMNSLVGDLG